MPDRSLVPASHSEPPHRFQQQPELRALMLLPTVPAGHMTFLVPDDRFAPHLQEGEFAVIDLSDRRPAHRELFLMSFETQRTRCGFAYQLVQMRRRQEYRHPDGLWSRRPADGATSVETWHACFWMPPENREEYQRLLRAGTVGTCDGPYTREHAAEKLAGRIVGLHVPP